MQIFKLFLGILMTLWWVWIGYLIYLHNWFALLSYGVCFLGVVAQHLWKEFKEEK